ncbi:SixA phosphatase family protein [Streptacidiphilus jiangxiensis]|uniref:Phosphohistidine phosphatase n=1 Tax=Streptacidiphilus jiangxiensis TaxID=235985 RepID=A0A1H7HN87_STRJI|nr:histidine phosphatase family protein [Streptacidiphilus jiangxiensis]SEK51694.1 phosphohistidine phosphatase [Streptacidiphilus jiangxiensis]
MSAETTPATARLIVLRHAKSAWPEGVPDLERPLAERGRHDAPRMGAWLRQAGLAPELVLCSPARRTRETWALVAEELGSAPIVAFEPRVYGAEVEELLQVLREVPREIGTVLLVAHFPGVQGLVQELVDGGDGVALERLNEKFPTAGAAVVELPPDWAALRRGTGTLTAFTVPRQLPSD